MVNIKCSHTLQQGKLNTKNLKDFIISSSDLVSEMSD